jgi:hypothetical protein
LVQRLRQVHVIHAPNKQRRSASQRPDIGALTTATRAIAACFTAASSTPSLCRDSGHFDPETLNARRQPSGAVKRGVSSEPWLLLKIALADAGKWVDV